MISTIISKLHAEGDTPQSPVLSATGSSPTAGGSVAGTDVHQSIELPRSSLSSMEDLDDQERKAVGSDSGSVKHLAKEKDPSSERGFAEDLAETGASASTSEREPIENLARQGETEIPVDHEDSGMYPPMKCGLRSKFADLSVTSHA